MAGWAGRTWRVSRLPCTQRFFQVGVRVFNCPQANFGAWFNGRARRGAGKPAGQDEEGKDGSECDDAGADQRAAAEAGDEGPIRCAGDQRMGARRRLPC